MAADNGFKVFVADLPQDISEDELRAVFQTYGEVTNIYILQPNAKGGGRACLITYAQRQSAEDAISVLHGQYKIRVDAQWPIKVQWAKDKSQSGPASPAAPQSFPPSFANDEFKLFIGGLPADCTEQELTMVFATYGEVAKVHMMPPHAESGRVAGFVYYKTMQAGEDAIAVLDDKYKIRADAERPILVKWASAKDKGKGKGKGGDQWGGDQWSSGGGKDWGGAGGGKGDKGPYKAPEGWKLFVGGLPGDITDGELMSVFQTYGEVAKVHMMPANNFGKVACFVYYVSQNSGDDAISVLHNIYKIRVDAAEPIQVRWASSGGGKGGGSGTTDAKGNFTGGDSSWNSGGGCKGGWDSGYGKGGGGKAAVGWDQSWSGGGGGGNSWDQSWSGGGDKGGDKGGKGWGGSKGGDKGSKGGGGVESETKLFVGNLPDDVTEDALKYVFGTYGTVRHVHVMVGRSNSGMACAFVDLSAASEADTAIGTLNDKYEIKPGCGAIMVKKARARGSPY